MNGVGGKLNEWEIYRSWARLVAAHGLAGILFEAKGAGSAAGVPAFFAHLSKNADALGLDATRLAAWSCSGNVGAGLPAVMAGEPIAFRAAVFYYGTGERPHSGRSCRSIGSLRDATARASSRDRRRSFRAP